MPRSRRSPSLPTAAPLLLSLRGRLRWLALQGLIGAPVGLGLALPGDAGAAGFGTAQWFGQAGATPVTGGRPANTGLPTGAADGLGGVITPDQARLRADRSLRDLNRSLEQINVARRDQQLAAQAALSLNADIPDGHVAGGLLEVQEAVVQRSDSQGCVNAAACLWVNAELPVATVDNGHHTVTVEQTDSKAILTWDSLRVGRNTTLHIDQRAGTQSDGRNDWVALNRVKPGAEPTVVQGQIKAEGTVYLINQNGVLFGAGSQVNVNSLLVSTLPLYQTGTVTSLAETSAAQLDASNRLFLSTGLTSVGTGTANGNVLGIADAGNLSIETAAQLDAVLPADIRIERGATISVNQEGFALIAAPNIHQAGRIAATDSQVVLAAGVGVTLTNNSGGRGFTTATGGRISDRSNGGADITPAFAIDNTGIVESLRGSLTMRATRIEQDGVLLSTTSVSRPGSIDLLARDQAGTLRYGAVGIGAGALAAILPDDATAAADTTNSTDSADALFRPLGITIGGAAITLASGALLEAPGHKVSLTAVAENDAAVSAAGLRDGEIAGRVYLDRDAVIDVAGLSDVRVPLANVLVRVPRLGLNELADSPLQRNGLLFGSAVVIDSRLSGVRDDGVAWVGTPLANVAGYVEQISRSVRELLSDAGDISLIGGEVIGRENSVLNLSGGYIHYLGGRLDSTRLVTASGSVVDIGNADPNVRYVGFAGQTVEAHPRWNLDRRFVNPLLSAVLGSRYEADDIWGGDAGVLTIASQSGSLLGSTVEGRALAGRQQVLSRQQPLGGGVTFGGNIGSQIYPGSSPATAGLSYRLAERLPGDPFGAGFAAGTALAPRGADAGNRDDSGWWVTVPVATLRDGGISRLKVLADLPEAVDLGGEIVVEAGTRVAVPAGGSIELSGSRLRVDGELTAHGGSITLQATGRSYNAGSTTAAQTAADQESARGDIVIADGATLDVSGLYVNDAGAAADAVHGDAWINGGSIRLTTLQSSQQSRLGTDSNGDEQVDVIDLTGSIRLEAGSTLDARSGAWLRPDGLLQRDANEVALGNGGSIALRTYVAAQVPFGRDPLLALPTVLPSAAGGLLLDGRLLGFGFNHGASLLLRAAEFQIGGTLAADRPWATALAPSLFTDNGFGRIELQALYDARIADNTVLQLQQRNLLPVAGGDGRLALFKLPTGTALDALQARGAVTSGLLDDFRRRPVDLVMNAGEYLTWGQRDPLDPNRISAPDLSAAGITGTLSIGLGARVLGDPGANLSFGSLNQLTVLGSLIAHGGKITLSIDTARGGYAQNPGFVSDGNAYSKAGKSIWLGPDSLIDVSGIAVIDRSSAAALAGTDVAGRVLGGGEVTLSADTGMVIAVSCTDLADCPGSGPALAGGSSKPAASDQPTGPTPSFGDNSGGGGGGGTGGGGGGSGGTDPQFPVVRQATINLSGTEATVGVLFPCTRLPLGTALFSDGGSLRIGAGTGLYFDARLLADGGSPQARGGTLAVTPLIGRLGSSNGFDGATRLQLSARPAALPAALKLPGRPLSSDPAAQPDGVIRFGVSVLDGAGFDNLILGSDPLLIADNDPVPIDIIDSLNIAVGRSISINTLHLNARPLNADGSASDARLEIGLNAPYVSLHGYRQGGIYEETANWQPAKGDARLNVNATAIDIGGHLALDGYRKVDLFAREDIRFVTPPAYSNILGNSLRYEAVPAVLQVSADIELSAGRLYPATGNSAYIIANNASLFGPGRSTASVSFKLAAGARATPLSVGGRLVVMADEIRQDGALYAPGGQIYLGVAKDADDFSNFALLQYPTGGGDTGFLLPVPTRKVTLSDGSITSVSLDRLTVPYGRTLDGQNLFFNGTGNRDARVDELLQSPEKVIGITGADVRVNDLAQINLRGGGDLIASEWVAGTGGSRDLLSSENIRFVNGVATPVPLYADGRPVYAIVPGYAGLAPFDPQFLSDPLIGQSVHLNGAPGLPAGDYVLLPAAYALLPGAYRVVQDTRIEALDALSDFTPGRLADGSLQATGYFRDTLTGARDARSTVFQVQAAPVWQQYSEYALTSLNTYFSDRAAADNTLLRAPGDAGKLSLLAGESLALNGRIVAGAPTGLAGAELQIAAPRLQVISGSATATDGYVSLSAERLNAIGASRIVLGATSIDFAGVIESFNVIANDLDIATLGTALQAGEIVLAANQPAAGNGITVRAGAGLQAVGNATGRDGRLITIGSLPSSFDEETGAPLDAVSGDGAFLQVSVNNANVPSRDYVPGQSYIDVDGLPRTVPGTAIGTLRIGDGARLIAPGSLTLEASGLINLASTTVLDSQALTVALPRIVIGNATGAGVVSSGASLRLGSAILDEIAGIASVSLIGSQSISFDGDSRLRAGRELVLDTGLLIGGSGTARLEAGAIRFVNTEDSEALATAAIGGGTLLAVADRVLFSSSRDFASLQLTSNQVFSGFARIDLDARQAVIADGDGRIDFGSAAIGLDMPRFASRSNADLRLTTLGALTARDSHAAPMTAPGLGLGARVAIDAAAIDWNTGLDARSGQIRLSATAGDLLLGNAARLDASGSVRSLFDATVATGGGSLRLEAAGGDIVVASGAVLDVSAPVIPAGATGAVKVDAGQIELLATQGEIAIDGRLIGRQSGSGAHAALGLNSGGAIDLDRLAAQMADGGIDGALDARSRSGNLQLSAGQQLRAQAVHLVADSTADGEGRIRIDGSIDARGSAGGEILLDGQQGVAIGGSLLASGSAADERGGRVELALGSRSDGGFDSRYGYQTVLRDGAATISLDRDAVIDVRGGSAGGHSGGTLLLRLPLLADGGIGLDIAPGAQLLGAAQPTIEAYARWDAADAIGSTPHFDGVLDPAGSSGVAGRASFVTDTLTAFIRDPGFSFGTAALPGTGWRARVGIDLVNSSSAINGGGITVASAWNLAAGSLDADGRPQLLLRTDGVAPAISLRALGDVRMDASLSDGFFQFVNPFRPAAGLDNRVSPGGIAGNPLPLHTASLLGLVAGADGVLQPYDSSSFRLVAGADLDSADPLARLDRFHSSADVLIAGNTRAASPVQPELSFVMPTLLRTGVGRIDIAATGDLQLLDADAPGVIYTAGHAGVPVGGLPGAARLVTVAAGQAPVIDSGVVQPTGAGDLRIRTGGDIVGITQVVDTDGSRTGSAGTDLSQYWWPWLQGSCLVTTEGCNAAARSSLNFGMFAQGVMSVGGNVDIVAGGSIRELSVSLPTTYRLDPDAADGFQRVGGGKLRLEAGDDWLGGSAFVAAGSARLKAGGRIGAGSFDAPVIGLQDAQVDVVAGRALVLGGAFNPSYLFQNFDSQAYSTDSALNVQAISGNLSFGSLQTTPGAAYGSNLDAGIGAVVQDGLPYLLPSTVRLTAGQGSLRVLRSGELFPSPLGQLSLLAQGDVALSAPVNNAFLGLIDAPLAVLPSVLNPLTIASVQPSFIRFGLQSDLRLHSPDALHARDAEPLRIYSEQGDLIDGDARRNYGGALRVASTKAAQLRAGRDIVNLHFSGQNLYRSDVTLIAAGRDLYEPRLEQGQSIPTLELGGPGTLTLTAGRDIGPLTSANDARALGYLTINGPQYPGIRTIGNLANAYLPREGASIDIRYGIAGGVKVDAFAEAYINPAVLHDPLNPADRLGTPDYSAKLVAFVRQLLIDDAARSGQPLPATLDALTPEAAWTAFQGLAAVQRERFVSAVFLDLLDQVGLDYNGIGRTVVDRAHLDGVRYSVDNIRFLGQYGRGYEAIETLFPAAAGYTENDLGGSRNGAIRQRRTGELDVRGSTVQTQFGGDVSILGPGGRILVGSASAPPFAPATATTAAVGPNSQGLLTLQGGSIRVFADDSVLLAQSRIFTQQGGDILIWSSNGDINAGKGAKTSSEIPPLQTRCNDDLFCLIDAGSQVSGAGIAALQSKPDAPAGSANLIAPVGTVDAGDAGIRVSGNLNVAALQVANADNIQVSGSSVGVPTALVDTGTAAAAAAGAAAASATAAQVADAARGNNAPEYELFVEVLVSDGP
ncbi:MAG: filamentous hemagglutinin family protein [Gammaproteobacteria bacterium]|nr:filamentous hemagglutinin family protein [Gammaproteobacteria bacterium]